MPDKRFWDDYSSRRAGTIGGDWGIEMDSLYQPKSVIEQLESLPTGKVTTPHQPRKPGLFWSLFKWYVDILPPLRWSASVAERLRDQVGWRVKLTLAFIGFIVAAGSAATDHAWTGSGSLLGAVLGPHAPMAWVALGTLAGWLSPSLLGYGIVLCAGLLALGLTIGTFAIAAALLWQLIMAVRG